MLDLKRKLESVLKVILRERNNLSSLIYTKSAREARRIEIFYNCLVISMSVFERRLQR